MAYKTILPTLLLIFVLAKSFAIGPVATWPWTWVLAPFWVPLAFVAIWGLVFVTIGIVATLLDVRGRR